MPDAEHNEQRGAYGRNGEAVAYGDEPDVAVEPHGADCQRHEEDNQERHTSSVSVWHGTPRVYGE